MRRIGFTIGNNAFRQPAAPVQSTVNRYSRRRLEDDIEDVFYKACAARDVERAADLVGLLERMQARRSVSYGRERRLNSGTLDRARQKLKQLGG